MSGPLRAGETLGIRFKGEYLPSGREGGRKTGKEIAKEHACVDDVPIQRMAAHEFDRLVLPNAPAQDFLRRRTMLTGFRHAITPKGVFAQCALNGRQLHSDGLSAAWRRLAKG